VVDYTAAISISVVFYWPHLQPNKKQLQSFLLGAGGDLMVVTAQLLKKFSILSDLAEPALMELAEASSLQKFNRREIVLAAGKQEDAICFLFEGRLQGVDFTIDGREVGLYFVNPGEFCGELTLFDHKAQPDHIIALTPSVTVFVPLTAMRDVMVDQPKILATLGTKLAGRIREMTFQRSLLGLPNIAQRVCCQLWLLVPKTTKGSGRANEITNPPTHMEIAIMLNVSRETVSRVFQALQNHKIVRRDGNSKLQIIRVDALKNLAEGTDELQS
jgi:CRP-like cAMP-binding protein